MQRSLSSYDHSDWSPGVYLNDHTAVLINNNKKTMPSSQERMWDEPVTEHSYYTTHKTVRIHTLLENIQVIIFNVLMSCFLSNYCIMIVFVTEDNIKVTNIVLHNTNYDNWTPAAKMCQFKCVSLSNPQLNSIQPLAQVGFTRNDFANPTLNNYPI